MHGRAGPAEFWLLTAMWFGMMIAMMAPSVWPWVQSFHRFSSRESGTGFSATAAFVAGYSAAWLAYSVGAAAVQLIVQDSGMLRHPTASMTSGLGAAVLLFAGIYQLAPVKRACLSHCRSPLGYFLRRWRDGPAGGFRLGVNHGLFCVGCCWALMATSFAVGVMNVWWTATLAAVAAIEQSAPQGHRLRVPVGVGFMIAGVWHYVI